MSSKVARTVIILLLVAVSGFLLKAPQGFKFALGLGYYLRDTGHPAISIPFFYVASLNNPESHLPHWGMGTMLAKIGKHGRALPHLLRATEIKREWTRASYTAHTAMVVGNVEVLKAALLIGREDNSAELLKDIFNEYLDRPWFFASQRNFKWVLGYADLLIRAEPEIVTWFEFRRRIWERHNWHSQNRATSVVENKIAQNSLIELQINDADALLQYAPDTKQARTYFQRVGNFALKAGRYKEARDWYVAGAKHDYTLMEERISSDFVIRDDQTFDKALAQSDGLIRVDSQNDLWWKMRLNFWRYQYTTGVVGLNKTDQDIAIRKLYDQQLADANRLIAAYPDNKLALQHRVFVLAAKGNKAEALQDLTAAGQLEKVQKQKVN
jgi:tetratricopeptide (TPR) repeat protein